SSGASQRREMVSFSASVPVSTSLPSASGSNLVLGDLAGNVPSLASTVRAPVPATEILTSLPAVASTGHLMEASTVGSGGAAACTTVWVVASVSPESASASVKVTV